MQYNFQTADLQYLKQQQQKQADKGNSVSL